MNQGLGPSTLLFTYISDDTVRYGPTSADTVTVSLVPLHFWIPRFNTLLMDVLDLLVSLVSCQSLSQFLYSCQKNLKREGRIKAQICPLCRLCQMIDTRWTLFARIGHTYNCGQCLDRRIGLHVPNRLRIIGNTSVTAQKYKSHCKFEENNYGANDLS